MNKENRFAENLKSLRKAWGETQKKLAEAIAQGPAFSESSISQWESGKKKPNSDALLRIAKHYHVTADQLLYEDLSQMDAVEFRVNKDDLMQLIEVMLPFATSPEAERDPIFLKALTMLQRLGENNEHSMSDNEWDLTEISKTFRASYKNNKTIEAMCNVVFCLMIDWLRTVDIDVATRFDRLPNKIEWVSGFFKKVSLGEVHIFNDEAMETREALSIVNSEAFDIILRIYRLKY